jgi:hypothetical protein
LLEHFLPFLFAGDKSRGSEHVLEFEHHVVKQLFWGIEIFRASLGPSRLDLHLVVFVHLLLHSIEWGWARNLLDFVVAAVCGFDFANNFVLALLPAAISTVILFFIIGLHIVAGILLMNLIVIPIR